MMSSNCPREPELLDILMQGRWPHSAGDELRQHVARCKECSDLALVAGSLIDDRVANEHSVTVPTSGGMWWRMQIRERLERKASAARTVQRAHAMTIALTVVIVGALLVTSSILQRAWAWWSGTTALEGGLSLSHLFASASPTLLVTAATALLIFVPLALVAAFARE